MSRLSPGSCSKPSSLLAALPARLCQGAKGPELLTEGCEPEGRDLLALTDCESFVRVQQRNTLSRRDQLVA